MSVILLTGNDVKHKFTISRLDTDEVQFLLGYLANSISCSQTWIHVTDATRWIYSRRRIGELSQRNRRERHSITFLRDLIIASHKFRTRAKAICAPMVILITGAKSFARRKRIVILTERYSGRKEDERKGTLQMAVMK